MAILVDRHTRVCIQGITGPMGQFQAQEMLSYGTNVVAGTSPGRSGTSVGPVPVFGTMAEAVAKTGANLSLIYVAAPRVKDAVFEAIDAGIRTIVCVAEWVPVHDMVMIMRRVREAGTRLQGLWIECQQARKQAVEVRVVRATDAHRRIEREGLGREPDRQHVVASTGEACARLQQRCRQQHERDDA